MTAQRIRVVIADDDPLVRAGLRTLLQGAPPPGIAVVGEASDGDEVLATLDRHRPDVLLLDLRMPRVDGLRALALVRAQPQPPAVLVLTTFETDQNVLRALRGGAAGFLVKDTPPAEIVRAIERLAAGEGALSPGASRRVAELLARDADGEQRRTDAAARLAVLTPRDREIAEAVGDGKANAAIAAELHLSVSTVKTRVSGILAELGLDNRVQIALLVHDARRA